MVQNVLFVREEHEASTRAGFDQQKRGASELPCGNGNGRPLERVFLGRLVGAGPDRQRAGDSL